MPKTKITKEKINISLDKELVQRLRNSRIKASSLINNLLWKHYSQVLTLQSQLAHNPEVDGSNTSFAMNFMPNIHTAVESELCSSSHILQGGCRTIFDARSKIFDFFRSSVLGTEFQIRSFLFFNFIKYINSRIDN